MRKRLFTAAVCSWMKPQLSVDIGADLDPEAAIQEMDIDWAEACRPDREYWKRTPMTWTRKALEAELSTKVAADATKGRKDQASQRLEAIFQNDKAHGVSMTAEEREQLNAWTIPGMRPRTDPDDPRVKLDAGLGYESVPAENAPDAQDETGESAGPDDATPATADAAAPPEPEAASSGILTAGAGGDDAAPAAAAAMDTTMVEPTGETPEDPGEANGLEDFDRSEATELPPFLRPTG